MMLNEQKKVWVWGDDRQGQLGLTPDDSPTDPLFIFAPKQLKKWGKSYFRDGKLSGQGKFSGPQYREQTDEPALFGESIHPHV